jgi:endoglucanase
MKLYESYRQGINLGGWLSQYEFNDVEHYNSFITEEDIKIISEWGADHVRLPVDYDVIQETSEPYRLREEGIEYVDRCINWCKQQHLKVILDLHKAPGQIYGYDKTPNPLLVEEEYKNRFISLWKALAKRYKDIENSLMFELLNEITDGTGYLWNFLYAETVEEIRSIDKDRIIIIGSNDSNRIFTLKELGLLDDENVVYNFHYYEPLVFTHQKAHFSKDMLSYNKVIEYPGEITGLGSFLNDNKEYAGRLGKYVWECNDNALMKKYFENARYFSEYTGKQLYCGEFGVISNAPSDSAIRWIRDLLDLFDVYKIGHAYWSYKEMDFGLVNIKGEVLNRELVKLLFNK